MGFIDLDIMGMTDGGQEDEERERERTLDVNQSRGLWGKIDLFVWLLLWFFYV